MSSRAVDLWRSVFNDDALLWRRPPIGLNQFRPDYLLLHPAHGLLTLVERDWSVSDLSDVDFAKSHSDPLEVSQTYARAITASIQSDPELKPLFTDAPAVTGAVMLPRLTEAQYEASGASKYWPRDKLLLADDLQIERSVAMVELAIERQLPGALTTPMTARQRDRIRWHCFPRLRIESPEDEQHAVLDLQKEQFLMSRHASRNYIRGSVGTGKTTLMLFLARQLVSSNGLNLLIACATKPLALVLRDQAVHLGIGDRVQVVNFDQLIDQRHSTDERHPLTTCKALLIDEAHKLPANWRKRLHGYCEEIPVFYFFDPDQGQAIVPDDIQTADLVLELRQNYRGTKQQVRLANIFSDDDKVCPTGRGWSPRQTRLPALDGDWPQLIRSQGLHAEIAFHLERLKTLSAQGILWRQMLILARSWEVCNLLRSELAIHEVPAEYCLRDEDSFFPTSNSVKVMASEQARGLEFDYVFMPGLGLINRSGNTYVNDMFLLYTAMTRARTQLFMSYHRHTPVVSRIQQALAERGVKSEVEVNRVIDPASGVSIPSRASRYDVSLA